MSRPAPAGYSGKPLFAKLGFKPGWRVGLINPPDHYDALVAGAEDVSFLRAGKNLDALHLFLSGPGQIADQAVCAIARLRPGSLLWVSWTKKSSKLFSGVTEDMLRSQILPLGWVDVKVFAVDKDWSALKFLKRKD